MSHTSRRHLLRTTAGGLAALAAASHVRAADPPPTDSDAITLAVIGPGGMGTNLLRSFAAMKDVRVTHVCDVDARRAGKAAEAAKAISGREAKVESDLRRVLDDKDVRAVVIATPDHWHGPAAILAAEAGKHIYVEKPASHNVREGRLMVEAARRNKVVMQVGTQGRSTPHVKEAFEYLRSGELGEILAAKAWNSQLRANIGRKQPGQAPAEVDYDTWVGPAPMVPFQENRFHSWWRWWHAFGTGDIGNDGVHDLDVARWGLDVDTLHPTSVTAIGGKYFFDDDQQFPDTQYVVYEYTLDDGKKRQLTFEQRIWSPYVQEGLENGSAYYGTKGYLILNRQGGYQAFGPKNKPIKNVAGKLDSALHHRNFLDCVRSGARPNADIEIGHRSAAVAHLGNIAARVGRRINFDPKAEQVVGDDEANALVRRQYREGHWAVPKGV
jgi:predicted dehydrogenase